MTDTTATTCKVPDCYRQAATRGWCSPCYLKGRRDGTIPKVNGYNVCSVDGCDKRTKAKGLCTLHYERQRRTGKTTAPPRYSTCTFEGCEAKHMAHGYCQKHLYRSKNGLPMEPDSLVQPRVGICAFDGCEKPVSGRGWCSGHYMQWRERRELTPLRTYLPRNVPCSVDDCERPAQVAGMCRAHRSRYLAATKDWTRPVREYAPAGEGHLNSDGYRIIYRNGRTISEHRAIMEDLLGRRLKGTETVHHINGNRSDNRIDGPLQMALAGRLRSGNLELWSTAQPAGQEIGAKIEWAVELLEQYAEFLAVGVRRRLRALPG